MGQANTMQGESQAKNIVQGLEGSHIGEGNIGQGPCRGSHLPLAAGKHSIICHMAILAQFTVLVFLVQITKLQPIYSPTGCASTNQHNFHNSPYFNTDI